MVNKHEQKVILVAASRAFFLVLTPDLPSLVPCR